MVRRISILILCTTILIPPLIWANPSVDVPLRHWSYDAIEKLAIVGLCDIADIGARPVSRIKMAYIIKSAIEKARDYNIDFDWQAQEYYETLLYDLIEEFREELITIGVEVAVNHDGGPKKYRFKIADPIRIEKLYTKLDIDQALFENKDGWKPKDGFNIRARITSWAKAANFFAVSLTPGIRYSREDTDADFENAHIRVSHPRLNLELALGRNSMWWGPGFHGSLLMTDNAFPLDMVRLNNKTPFRLPWIFRRLGRFNGIFFVSRLEEKRAVPNVSVAGWRLDYTPWGFLKFGAGHILMFGGKGVKRLGFANFISSASLVFSPAGGETETENHIISGDIQLFLRRIDRFLPIATGAKLYIEGGAEDEAGNIPKILAGIIGAFFTDIFKVPGLDGKIEYARFESGWYQHFRYTSGYTHRGNIIGHHVGENADDFAISGIAHFPNEAKLTGTISHQRRGLNSALIETTDEIRLEFSLINGLKQYNIENIDISISYEFERINNYQNTSKSVRNHFLGVEVSRKF